MNSSMTRQSGETRSAMTAKTGMVRRMSTRSAAKLTRRPDPASTSTQHKETKGGITGE